MTQQLDFDIRYSTMEDLDYLKKWLEKKEEVENFPFNDQEKGVALKNWIGFSKYKASLTAVVDGVPSAVGTLFLMPYRKVAHHCSFYLIVDPKYRLRGIGTSMVKNLLHLAKTQFRLENVHVEVFSGTKLIPILQKEGFKEIVRQDNFMKVGGKSKARLIWEHSFL